MSERKYLKLLSKAQLATTRKEALKVLKKARKLELIENDYQLNALKKRIIGIYYNNYVYRFLY